MRGLTSGGLALASTLLHQLGGLVVTLLAARFLLPADYGIYAIAAVFLLLFQEFTYTGVTHFLVTQDEGEARQLSTGFWSIVIFSSLAALFLILVAPLLSGLFSAPELGPMLQLMVLAQPVSAYQAWTCALLQRRQQMLLYYKLLVWQNFFSLIGGIVALLVWQSLFALVVYYHVRALSGLLVCLVFAREGPGWHLDLPLFRKIARYSGYLYGTRFLQFFSNYGADLVLGVYLSTAATGIYRLGNRIAVLPVELIGHPVRTFALTQFGAANRTGESFTPIVLRLVSTMTFLMGCVGLTVAIFSAEIFSVLFQPAYLPAVPIVLALVVRSIIGITDTLLDPILAAANRTRLMFLHRSIWAIASVAAIVIAAPFGGVAVAWSLAGVMVGASTMALVLATRFCALDWAALLRTLARALLFVGLYCAAAWGIYTLAQGALPHAWMVLGVGLGACGLVGLLCLLASIRLGVVDPAVFASR